MSVGGVCLSGKAWAAGCGQMAQRASDGWLDNQSLVVLLTLIKCIIIPVVNLSKGELLPFLYPYDCIISGDGWNLNLLFTEFHLHLQTSDALLELAVLGGVDERVDATVGVHQYHGEVIEQP